MTTTAGESVIGTPTREWDELRRTNEQLAQSQRVAGIGSWELDPAAGTVTCSDQMYRLFGVDPEVFRPSLESFFALVHPDDQASVTETLARATATKGPVAMDHRIVRPDGTVRTVRLNADETLADDGSVKLICGTDQDVTDLRVVEDELRHQNETLALVTQATNDAVWERSLPGGMMIWHHGLEAYGYLAEAVAELEGSPRSLIHPEDLDRVRSSADAAVMGGDANWSCRFRFCRSDRSYVSVLARAQIVRDAGGTGIRMVGSLLDLTDPERLQDLDRRKEASAAVLGRASHELRTPLNAILGFTELLEEQLQAAITSRQLRYLQNIHTAGRDLLRLIDDVLDLSKAAAGGIALDPHPVSLLDLLGPVLRSTRELAAAKGVALSIDVPIDRALLVDVGRLRQILEALLSNAVKFTPAGGSVTLRAQADGGTLELAVADTGVGIPADRQDRVFVAFERLHDEERATSGSALGLALARELVQLHRGTISFVSAPGKGTTFRVVLPDVIAVAIATDRLLVVEDERLDADLIVALAVGFGVATEVTRTIADARAAIARARPRAVVLDLQLPDGRGDELLRSLRADPATRDLPVIVISGEDDRGTSAALGADQHLTKPLDHVRLRAWLDRVAGLADHRPVALPS
ncbi:MAG TPA: PAS domain-containing protein [Candidatus Saccharimonadales bacterium]|nr:PAS domain-containing protein [Candidatus Saccharimonadales bacterium]